MLSHWSLAKIHTSIPLLRFYVYILDSIPPFGLPKLSSVHLISGIRQSPDLNIDILCVCDLLPVRPMKGRRGLGWRCLRSTAPGRELTWVSWPRKSLAEEGGDEEEVLFWHSSSSQSEKAKVAIMVLF